MEMPGNAGALPFERGPKGLVVTVPENQPHEYAYALKIA